VGKCRTCGHPPSPEPYYKNVGNETTQDHASIFRDTQYAAGVVIQDEFQVPAVDSDIQVSVKNLVNVVVGSYLWHPAYGSLKIVYWDDCKKKIGLLNEGLTGNAAPGSVVPECTAFVPSSRPCCADQDNFQLFPFLAEDFEAPGVGQSRTIQVTSTFGLVEGTNIRIGTGIYYLEQINSSLEVVITNTGAGQTPGDIVEAKDSDGNFQYLLTTLIASICGTGDIATGRIVVCDGASEQLLAGEYQGQVPTLIDPVTGDVKFQLIDAEVRVCTSLTAPMSITAVQDTYTISVNDESVFSIGDILQINFLQLRWEVTDNTTPGQLDITCTQGNPLVIINVPIGSAVCIQLTDEYLQEEIDDAVSTINDLISVQLTGWVSLSATGTYTSASVFQVPGNVTQYLSIGQKFKFKLNGVNFYGNIRSFAYGGVTTAVTIVVNDQSILTNQAITDIQISNQFPPDFPASFSWVPIATGWASTPFPLGRYTITGRLFEAAIVMSGAVSNATTFDLSIPIVPVTGQGTHGYAFDMVNAGGTLLTIGAVFAAGLNAGVSPNGSSTGVWTNSGTKSASVRLSFLIS